MNIMLGLNQVQGIYCMMPYSASTSLMLLEISGVVSAASELLVVVCFLNLMLHLDVFQFAKIHL